MVLCASRRSEASAPPARARGVARGEWRRDGSTARRPRIRPAPRGRARSLGYFTLLALLVFGATSRAEIEFVGILATATRAQFALTDTTTARTSWVTRGDTFAGYVITDYDRANDTLTLTRDGVATRVKLKDDAKIKNARLELTGTVTFAANDKLQVTRATLLFDQENVFPLKDGITYRITPTRRPDGTIAFKMAIDRAVSPNTMQTIAAPAIVTLPGQEFSLKIDDLGFAFTPRTP
jgi:hypothetical protein